MISAAISTSVSGLNAASRRLENSANNVANSSSTSQSVNGETVKEAFRPQQVQQSSLESGGTSTALRESSPATVPVYEPGNPSANAEGITEYPNVDLVEEVVSQQVASYDFQANLKVLKAADEMLEETLNIIA